MSTTPRRLEDLTPQEKRALLVRTLQKQSADLDLLLDDVAATTTDLAVEAVLDPSIRANGLPGHPSPAPARVLLTGATGFLGAFLLAELLAQTDADIYCLVRASDAEAGRDRLRRALTGYGLGQEASSARIVPVPGDLEQVRLGLGEPAFERLAGTVDTVYHSGALTNWVYPYTRLKAANVGGTHELLRLATTAVVKPVHFVSTLAIFPLLGHETASIIHEQDSLDHGGVLYGGYPQSKWVAEKLVTTARSRGVPVAIYRPSLIVGHSRTGAWNAEDSMCRMIQAWVQLGCAYELDATVNMVPVDFVSRAIVRLSTRPESLGGCYHFAHPVAVPQAQVTAWVKSFGYPLRRVSYHEWRSDLIELARHRPGVAPSLVPLFSLTQASAGPAAVQKLPSFDCRHTLAALAGVGPECPTVDETLFHRYLSFLVRCGALPAPGAAAGASEHTHTDGRRSG